MNILILTTHLSKEKGGAEIALNLLINFLLKNKFNLKVISTDSHIENIKTENLEIHNFKTFISFRNFKISIRFFIKAISSKFDIIFSHQFYTFPSLMAAIISAIKKRPFILKPIGPVPPRIKNTFIGKLFNNTIGQFIFNSATIIVPTSISEKKRLIKRGIDERKIKVIPSGVDIDYFKRKPRNLNSIRKKYNIKSSDKILLNVGRVEHIKNQKLLIEAFDIISKKNSEIKLFLVGYDETEYKKKLLKLIKELRLKDKIFFTGKLNKREVLSFYKLAEIFVLSSLMEGSPLTIKEAMSAGVPIIASDVGGNSELIKNSWNGFVFKPNSSKELSILLMKLLENKNLQKKFISNSKIFVKKFTWNNYLTQMKTLFLEQTKNIRK